MYRQVETDDDPVRLSCVLQSGSVSGDLRRARTERQKRQKNEKIPKSGPMMTTQICIPQRFPFQVGVPSLILHHGFIHDSIRLAPTPNI